MNRDDIIRMAREAGLYVEPHGGGNWAVPLVSDLPERVERFATIIAAAEREACASICFQEGPSIDGELIAEAIRARSNE